MSRPTTSVAIVGPLLPFRGGIAQHTTHLHRALREIADVSTYAFCRQHPRWLYPGSSDRDPELGGYQEPGVRYWLDSLRPDTWLRVARAITRTRPDLVLVPWWTAYLGHCLYPLVRLLRSQGLRVAVMCHNVHDHEANGITRQISRAMLRSASAWVVHSRVDERALMERLPAVPIVVHPHPPWTTYPPTPRRSLPRRASLELLTFGFVRPYKGLDTLVEAIDLLRAQDLRLTIVGEFFSGRAQLEAQIRQRNLADKIDLVPRFVTSDETAAYFSRADLVVLPYRQATNSGVIPLAYYFDRPVVATTVGGLPEAVWPGETGALVPPDQPEALARAIASFTADVRAPLVEHIRRYRDQYSWSSFAQAIADLAASQR